jgi:hypothetical protein
MANPTMLAMIAGVILSFAGASEAPAASHEQKAGGLVLELNKLDSEATDNNACRVYMRVTEGYGEDVEQLDVYLVLFDTQDVVLRQYVVPLAPLSAQKTRVRLFDLPETKCGDIGSVLFNGIVACEPSTAAACMSRKIQLRSKVDNVKLFE